MADDPEDPPLERLETLFAAGYAADHFPTQVLTMLHEGARQCREITLGECTEEEGRLLYRGRLYVPDHEPLRLFLLRTHHQTPAVGHPGRSKTLELLQRPYHWPRMRADVARFVRNCHACQRSRTARHRPFGILRPLPVPDRPWQDISMDFVTGLPWSDGCDAIWVVVDRLTKARHFVGCKTDVDAADLADLFLEHVFRLDGLPRTITSD